METAEAAVTIAPVTGKYYITRDGTLVGPVKKRVPDDNFYPFEAPIPGCTVRSTWTAEGRYFREDSCHRWDLVELIDNDARARTALNHITTHYYVVDYHHIDDMRPFRPLGEATGGTPVHELDVANLRTALTSLFKDAGWEGDGEIQCCFIPSCFVTPAHADGYSVVIYHVKQRNNGTSYIALPRNMTFQTPVGWLTQPGQ